VTVDRRAVLLGVIAAGIAGRSAGQTAPPAGAHPAPAGLPQPTETLDLWPDGAPGMPHAPPVEIVTERSTDAQVTDRAVLGISGPRLAVFRPRLPNGAAVVIAPGGGYRWVVIDKEGYELGRWLSGRGITVFVLFYRLPGEGWQERANVALADAQRAIRLVRHRAQDFGIDPGRVGAIGFSAGGHVCADLAARFAQPVYEPVDAADRLSARPTVAAPIYPVISMSLPVAHAGSRENLLGDDPSPRLERLHSPQHNVPGDAPPHFLVHAEDDASVRVDNTLELRAALKARNVPVETHLFTHGGHGFGLQKAQGKPAGAWPELFVNWAATNGLL
jgi:acetyl esterase/lipase